MTWMSDSLNYDSIFYNFIQTGPFQEKKKKRAAQFIIFFILLYGFRNLNLREGWVS